MCLQDSLCSIPLNLVCNMTTLKMFFFTFRSHVGVEGVCKDRICAMLYSLLFDMQHDLFQRKMF